jgi:uncharacterized repeat protein (TIGR01451 family)
MKPKHKLFLGALVASSLGLALVFAVAVAANGTPAIDWWVFGAGGAPSSNGGVTLEDTLGQIVIGPSSAGDTSLEAGFWGGVGDLPELTVLKAAAPGDPRPGRTVAYTITVSNDGAGDATGAVISDTMPSDIVFAGPVTLEPPGAGTVGSPPLLVHSATITAGTSITVTFPVTVNACLATGALITNTASVSCTEMPAPVWASVPITVSNVKPKLGTVDPASGSGPISTTTFFTTTWTDDNCWTDLKQCYFHIGDSATIAGNVTLMYNARKDKLWLWDDVGWAWTGGYAPGTDNTMENDQATLYCALTTAAGSGDTVSVKWALEFKLGFEGDKRTGLKCKDRYKARAKGRWKGDWTVTGP